MRLVPKEWDEYNPVLVALGVLFVLCGVYALAVMGVSGPLIGWLIRAIFAIPAALGVIILIRQFQLRRGHGAAPTALGVHSLFYGECGTSRKDIVRWWEERRFRYNLYVGRLGLVSWLLVLFAGAAAVRPGVDFEEPIVMFLGPILYMILANVCYTLGWIVDIVAYRASPRRGLFKAGFIFSVGLTALPGIWAVTAWLITIFTGRKL